MPVPAVGGSMNSIYKMRGRMPGGAGMPESTFKAFDSQSFGRFQRKNKKVTEFLLEGKSNPRYELMMKMVRVYEKMIKSTRYRNGRSQITLCNHHFGLYQGHMYRLGSK